VLFNNELPWPCAGRAPRHLPHYKRSTRIAARCAINIYLPRLDKAPHGPQDAASGRQLTPNP